MEIEKIQQVLEIIEEIINDESQYSDDFIDLCEARSALNSVLDRR